jgi:hypothetical protein
VEDGVSIATSKMIRTQDPPALTVSGETRWRDALAAELMIKIKKATGLVTFKVEDQGFEPRTPCVQGRCSSQLS